MRRIIVATCLLAMTTPGLAQGVPSEEAKPVPEQTGLDYVLMNDGALVRGEIVENGKRLFLRDEKDGQVVPASSVAAAFSREHYQRIQNSSRWDAARDSLYRFRAGEAYVWNPEHRFSFFKNDSAVRITKIALIGLSGLFYAQAIQANRRVANSTDFVNAATAHREFVQARNRYYGVLGLTLGFFAFETGYAYFNFGTHVDGTDLRIGRQEPISVHEYIQKSNHGANRTQELHMAWEMQF